MRQRTVCCGLVKLPAAGSRGQRAVWQPTERDSMAARRGVGGGSGDT